MAISLELLVVLALVSLPATLGYRLWISPLKNIPGPFWARCSILWKLWHVYNDTYAVAIRKAHDQYGPFVRVTYEEVSVCNDEAVSKILMPMYNKSAWYKIFAMPDTSFINQMSEVNAVRYVETRKKVASGYSLSTVLKAESRMDELITLFKDGVNGSMQESGKVSLEHWFTYFAFDIIGTVTFSKDFGFLREKRDVGGCCATSEQLINYLSIFGFFPRVHDYLSFYLSPVMAWLDIEPMRHVLRTTKKCITRHEEDGSSHSDMVSAWRAYKGSEPLTDRQVFAACLANVAAGGDTVSGMAQAFVWHVLHNPTAKEKLENELLEAKSNGKLSSPAQYSETLKLPYFQACLKETYRVHPLVPTGTARVAPSEGVEIGGNVFPKGTVLSINQWALHYNKEFFGADAYEFKPERWLGKNIHLLEKHAIPFGSGYMTCPGRHLAITEMGKLLPTLFSDYEISLADPAKQWHINETILCKATGWEVVLSERNKEKKI